MHALRYGISQEKAMTARSSKPMMWQDLDTLEPEIGMEVWLGNRETGRMDWCVFADRAKTHFYPGRTWVTKFGKTPIEIYFKPDCWHPIPNHPRG